MKKALLASALLLAFSITTLGQAQKKRRAKSPSPPKPTEWKVEGKPVWKLEDAWNAGLKTDEMIMAMMPQKSLRFSLEDNTLQAFNAFSDNGKSDS
jgi:hypothetical protein